MPLGLEYLYGNNTPGLRRPSMGRMRRSSVPQSPRSTMFGSHGSSSGMTGLPSTPQPQGGGMIPQAQQLPPSAALSVWGMLPSYRNPQMTMMAGESGSSIPTLQQRIQALGGQDQAAALGEQFMRQMTGPVPTYRSDAAGQLAGQNQMTGFTGQEQGMGDARAQLLGDQAQVQTPLGFNPVLMDQVPDPRAGLPNLAPEPQVSDFQRGDYFPGSFDVEPGPIGGANLQRRPSERPGIPGAPLTATTRDAEGSVVAADPFTGLPSPARQGSLDLRRSRRQAMRDMARERQERRMAMRQRGGGAVPGGTSTATDSGGLTNSQRTVVQGAFSPAAGPDGQLIQPESIASLRDLYLSEEFQNNPEAAAQALQNQMTQREFEEAVTSGGVLSPDLAAWLQKVRNAWGYRSNTSGYGPENSRIRAPLGVGEIPRGMF